MIVVPLVERAAVETTTRSFDRRDLRASVCDCAAYSVMVGCGESYLPAFALAAGLSEVMAGLVTTIPLLIGATLQLLAPWALRQVGSYRLWVVGCGMAQALAFVPLAIAAWTKTVPAWLVFAAAACYWAADKGSGGAWNTWIGRLVPRHVRANFFARRSRIGQACVLTGFLAGGVALECGRVNGAVLDAFGMVFLAAGACRFISAQSLARQRDVPAPHRLERHVPLTEWLRRLRGSPDGTLLLYFLCVQGAAQISGPYFNPYMLRHLNLSYLEYVALVGAAIVARVVALPALGKFANRWGARRLLWLGGVGIVPMSAAWLVSDNLAYLIGLQLAVGAVWAAYELATTLLFLEALRPDERTSVVTRYNFAHAVITVAGSLLGGWALRSFGQSVEIYWVLFGVSSLARLASLGVLWRVPLPAAISLPEPEVVTVPTISEFEEGALTQAA